MPCVRVGEKEGGNKEESGGDNEKPTIALCTAVTLYTVVTHLQTPLEVAAGDQWAVLFQISSSSLAKDFGLPMAMVRWSLFSITFSSALGTLDLKA